MEKITREILIEKVATKAEITKKEAKVLVESVLDVIKEEVIAGNTIQLQSFGKFEVVERAEKNGVNPKTKEKIVIPACKAPKFSFAKEVKEAVK